MANILSYIKTVWKAGREGGTAWTPDRLNNIEGGIEQATNQINKNSQDIETINSNLSYKAGDVFTISSLSQINGVLETRTELRTFLPLSKPISANSFTVNITYLEIYCNGYNINETNKVGSITGFVVNNGIYITITPSSGIEFDNHCPIRSACVVKLKGTITFN